MKNSNPKYVPVFKEALDKILLGAGKAEAGKMFGYPAYYANSKLAICHYHEGIAVKLPEELAIKNIQQRNNCEHFCPAGRKMGKNWVILFPQTVNDIKADKSLYLKSVEFVKSLNK